MPEGGEPFEPCAGRIYSRRQDLVSSVNREPALAL